MTAAALPPFRLEHHFGKWEFRARYNVAASDAQTMTVAQLLELADDADRKAWDELALGYTQMEGDPELRARIAATYRGLDADDVVCFAGAEEGLWCALQATLGSGEHALVTTPNYQSMEAVVLSLGTATALPLRSERDWTLDLDAVRAAMRPQTRLIAVNFPNNPTGAVASHETFRALIDLAAERDAWFFSDEVYRGLERDPATRLPQAAELYERGISLGVMSKAYGLAGLRVGWIACRDRALLAKLMALKQYLSICNSGPAEILSRIALKAREHILSRVNGLIDANVRLLDAFFARHRDRFEWNAPPAACIAFPRYLGREGADAYCERLVEGHGILLVPSSIFASELATIPTDRFRIGFGRANLAEALDVWERTFS